MSSFNQVVQLIDQVNEKTERKTGWDISIVQSEITISISTRTISVTPTGTSFSYWIRGVKYSFDSAQTVVIDDTEGLWFIYFENRTLIASQTPWVLDAEDKCMVTLVYWDATNNLDNHLGWEAHGFQMDGATHHNKHDTNGSKLGSGGTLSDMDVDGTGNDNTNAQFQNDPTEIYDEDIELEHAARTKATNLTKWYRDGVDGSNIWRMDEDDPYPIVDDGVNDRAAWNELTGGSWQLTEVTDNQFVLAHIFVINDATRKFACIIGQSDYATKRDARAGAETELADLITAGLPTLEFVPIATLIIQTKDSYGNTPKSKIVSTTDGGDYVSWLIVTISRIGISATHFDPHAIHNNVPSEITTVTEKATLVGADEFLIEDSAAAEVKKSAKISAIRITESQITDLDHSLNFSELDDVNLTAISNSELLQWNDPSSKWINQTIAELGLLLVADKYTDAEAVAAVEAAGLAIATTKLLAFDDGGSADLIIDDDSMATATALSLSSSESIVAYIASNASTDDEVIHFQVLFPSAGMVLSSFIGGVFSVANSDTNALLTGTCFVKDEGSFKLRCAVSISAAPTANKIQTTTYWGAIADDEADAYNLVNADNTDFLTSLATAADIYIREWATAKTIGDNEKVSFQITKRANDGAGTFRIYAVWLERQ